MTSELDPTIQNPYIRGPIFPPEREVPEPIDIEAGCLVASYSVEHVGRDIDVYRYNPYEVLPLGLAMHIRHNTLTDSRISTATAEDRARVGDVESFRNTFNFEQDGRTFWCAVARPDEENPDPQLAGIVWVHPLRDRDEYGGDIVEACVDFNKRFIESANEQELSHEEVDERIIKPHLMGTLASRVYFGFRHKGVHSQMVISALTDYYELMEGHCRGVVIRLSKSDPSAMSAFTDSRLKHLMRFEPIHDSDGVYYMAQRGITDAKAVLVGAGIESPPTQEDVANEE